MINRDPKLDMHIPDALSMDVNLLGHEANPNLILSSER